MSSQKPLQKRLNSKRTISRIAKPIKSENEYCRTNSILPIAKEQKAKSAKEILEDLKRNPPSVTNYMVGVTITTNKPKVLFDNPTEQMLFSLLQTPLGCLPPPMPQVPLRDRLDIKKILATSLPVNDSDNPRDKETTKTLNMAKKILENYINNGGNVQGFINDYYGDLQAYHNTWKVSQEAALNSCRQDEPEVAKEFIMRINEDLQSKGIRPIKLPPKYKRLIEADFQE
jgi:hypothetical protein